MVVGKEISESGTPHLQGAALFDTQITLYKFKQLLGWKRMHIESMRGTPQQSLDYCSKQDLTPFVSGTMPQPGTRNDILAAVHKLKDGSTLCQMVEDDDCAAVYVKFAKGLTALRALLEEPRVGAPQVVWLWGETGTGKTRRAIQYADSIAKSYWISAGSLRWFDGYEGQHVAILDDLRTKHTTFSFLLRVLDRYPLRVEFKGGFINWVPHVIIVTAPYTPQRMYNLSNEGDMAQLTRRITHIHECRMDDGLGFPIPVIPDDGNLGHGIAPPTGPELVVAPKCPATVQELDESLDLDDLDSDEDTELLSSSEDCF